MTWLYPDQCQTVSRPTRRGPRSTTFVDCAGLFGTNADSVSGMRTNSKLNRLLNEAEANRLCIWSTSDTQRRTLQRREAAGELVRVGIRCFARTEYWQRLSHIERFRHHIRTLARIHPHWVFGGPTAAVMHGICDSIRQMKEIHRVMPANAMVRSNHIMHNHYIRSDEHVIVDDVRVTTLGRTIFDCARWLAFPDALPVIESALRQRIITLDELNRIFRSEEGLNRRSALHALRYASGKTENGGEAYALAVMIEEGFAPPQLQVAMPCVNEKGNPDRVDFFWRTNDGRSIVAELDGRIKYRDESMYRNGNLSDTIIAEKEREERIRMTVTSMVRFSFVEAYRRTDLVRKLEWAGVPRVTDSTVSTDAVG